MTAGIGRLAAAGWGQGFAALLLILAMRLYSGALGPEGFGEAMLALGGLALVDSFGMMAFAQVLPQVLKDRTDRSERVALALGAGRDALIWFGALAAICVVAALAIYGTAGALVLAGAGVLYAMAEPVRIAGQSLALLERRLSFLSAWTAGEALLVLGGSLLAIALLPAAPLALVAGAVAGRALAVPLFAPFALGHPRSWRADRVAARAELPRMLRFGVPIAISAPLAWLGIYADRYIVGGTLGLVEAGALAAMVGIVVRPFAIATAGLTNAFRPELLEREAGRPTRDADPLRNWLLAAAGIGALGIAGMALLGRPVADFVLAFDSSALPLGTVATLIAASQALVLLTHAFDNRILVAERSRALVTMQAVLLPFGLGAIVLGAATWGLVGAAAGRIVHEGLKLLGAAWLVRRIEAPAPLAGRAG